jgi:hypothetical protein
MCAHDLIFSFSFSSELIDVVDFLRSSSSSDAELLHCRGELADPWAIEVEASSRRSEVGSEVNAGDSGRVIERGRRAAVMGIVG